MYTCNLHSFKRTPQVELHINLQGWAVRREYEGEGEREGNQIYFGVNNSG